MFDVYSARLGGGEEAETSGKTVAYPSNLLILQHVMRSN